MIAVAAAVRGPATERIPKPRFERRRQSSLREPLAKKGNRCLEGWGAADSRPSLVLPPPGRPRKVFAAFSQISPHSPSALVVT